MIGENLRQAYYSPRGLAYTFSKDKNKRIAFKRLTLWYNKVREVGFKAFNSVSRII